MAKPPGRAERRMIERAAKKLVRDRERLAALERGGSPEHPISVESAAVIEVRVGALPCPQCGGEYRIREHAAAPSGLRQLDVICRICAAPRSLWFRIAPATAN